MTFGGVAMFLDETVLRMFERILVVLGGTMTIFLGYRFRLCDFMVGLAV
jgi:hypothetical protein